MIAGTFTAVGQSAEETINNPRMLILDFAGGGRVQMQVFINNEWKELRSFKESYKNRFNPPASSLKYRLACTNFAANIDYFLG